MNDDDYDDIRAELIAEARAERRRMAAYLAHPDPRDPLWPGHGCDEDEQEHEHETDD